MFNIFGGSLLPTIFVISVWAGQDIYVQEGQGFVIEMAHFENVISCAVQFGTDLVDLNQNLTYTTNRGEIICPIGHKTCGCRVWNVSSSDSSGGWKLIAVDEYLMRFSDIFRVSVLQAVPTNQTVLLKGLPGQRAFIDCGHEDAASDCVFKDLGIGGSEQDKCEIWSEFPEPGQKSAYSCRFRSNGSMAENYREYRLTSVIKNPVETVPEVLDLENSKILQCSSANVFGSCIAKHYRTGQTLYIQNGLVHQRYSAYRTSTALGICQLEIPLPFLANETGVWVLYKTFNNLKKTGCIFHLGDQSNDDYLNFEDSLKEPRSIRTKSKTISVRCANAPYKITSCYLRTPTNELLAKSQTEIELSGSIGLCEFGDVTVGAGGRFTCGFNAKNENDNDLRSLIDVEFYEKDVLEVENREVQTPRNDPVKLLCSSALSSSVSECLFVSPSDDSYFISHNSLQKDGYAYYGKGLENGDCGISLYQNVSNWDFYGPWTCTVNIFEDGKKIALKERIFVYPSGIVTDI